MIDLSDNFAQYQTGILTSPWQVCSRAEEYRLEIEQDRQTWRCEQPGCCMYCGASPRWPELQVHEIERKSQAPRSWAQRCNYLLLCQPCHAGPFATMPHAKQLALKYLCDPKHFDLPGWLKIKDPNGLAPNRVTQEEIDKYVQELLLIPGIVRAISSLHQSKPYLGLVIKNRNSQQTPANKGDRG